MPTPQEHKRLIQVTLGARHARRNAALLACSYKLGFRAKELSSLRVRDVVNERDELLEECSLVSYMTKGGKPRVAYLTSPSLRAALRAYLEERRAREDILFNFDAPLFKSQKGNHFSPNTLQQLLARLHMRAGITGGRSHSGRRWFATELISRGIDLKAVSVLMGHSTVSMTAQYAEDNPQRLRKIAAMLT